MVLVIYMAKKGNNKKNKNVKKVEEVNTPNDGWYDKLILILVVICILCLFYLLTVYLTEKESTESAANKPEEETVIQYDEILAGSTFNKPDEKYFVVYYDMSSEDIADITSAIGAYNAKEDALPLYTVDMSNPLNKNYASKDSNKSVDEASELRINGVTLIRVKDGELDKYLEGEDEVVEYLN